MRSIAVASLFALACGGSSVHHLADAGGDAALPVDAALPDSSGPGMVSVIVTLQGVPAMNVPVYFQNADSSLVGSAEVLTDGSGVASAVMTAGGFVTVLEPQAPLADVVSVTNQTLSTFSGVKVGDVLHDDLEPPSTLTSAGMTVTGAGDSNPAVTGYTLFDSCSGQSETSGSGSNLVPGEITFNNCTTGDLLVVSHDANGTPLDYLLVTGITVVNSGTINVTGTYTPVTQQAFAFTDTPPEVSQVDIEELVSIGSAALFDTGVFAFDNTAGGMGSAIIPVPASGAAFTAGFAIDLAPAGNIVDEQTLVSWGPPPTGIVTVDVGARRLRNWVTRPMMDVVSGQLQWAVGDAGSTPDYVLGAVSATRSGAVTSTWTWSVAAAANDDGAIVFPTLPTDIFDFNFHDTDALTVEALVGALTPGGYDAARPVVFDDFNDFNAFGNPLEASLGSATGSAAVQIFGPDFD
jgi:hypothetical protein